MCIFDKQHIFLLLLLPACSSLLCTLPCPNRRRYNVGYTAIIPYTRFFLQPLCPDLWLPGFSAHSHRSL
ncbi:hypothetical protein HMPREF1548_02764 [Clostridium sp. KLE 1755]|nr:hypothetical protein HMPREF1548_02764 [Clostridium sp. KLE 1755]